MTHWKLGDADYALIGSKSALARATAISRGEPWELPGYAGTALAARVAVTTIPTVKPTAAKYISDADYARMSPTQRLVRATQLAGVPQSERIRDQIAGRPSRRI